MKPIKYIEAKGKNRRIDIYYFEDEKGNKGFEVYTKRLIDLKTRNISETKNGYSIETFYMLSQLFDHMLNDKELTNKLIHLDISKIEKWQASTNIKL